MGSGTWTTKAFCNYSTSTGRTTTMDGIVLNSKLQDFYKQTYLHQDLNPYKVTRECCDSEEHPNTIPVILALDVTGSMGAACLKTAQQLNKIMTDLYDQFDDIEFMVMGIGDLAYDNAPIQVSQYESDVRIAEHLDKIYMEHGGGGNGYESYTAAWLIGARHTALDCWKRGKKGIIITLGDEPLNPYLPARELNAILGTNYQANIETDALYEEVIKQFDVYHIAINDADSCYYHYRPAIERTWGAKLGPNYKAATLAELPQVIVGCIANSVDKGDYVVIEKVPEGKTSFDEEGMVTW